MQGFEGSEGAGELVGAAGAAGVAVDAGEAGDDFVDALAGAEGGDALGVAVAAVRILYVADDVAFELDVNAGGADHVAGLERGFADAVFGPVAEENYIVDIHCRTIVLC